MATDSNDRDVDRTSTDNSRVFARLIAEARDGSADARNELIRSLRGYLTLIARQELDSQLQAKVGASDLVQSALLQAEQNLDQFRGNANKHYWPG